jgi:enamine deaminase RidA (YjgF/YER057c/UK114 family)
MIFDTVSVLNQIDHISNKKPVSGRIAVIVRSNRFNEHGAWSRTMELLKRENFSSGAPLEDKVGYSRAVKVGSFVFVGGTTTTTPEGEVEAEGDAYLQTKIILQKIEKALTGAGARLSEVYRVRIYVTDISRAQEYMQAYSEFFKEIKPVTILAEVSALARPAHLVEIEAEAVIGSYMLSKK